MKTIETDVLVVGGGASGLAAASEAARLGKRTILLEKMPTTGGMMDWAVGTVTVANSPHQKRIGVSDSKEAHFEDLGILAGRYAARDNLALRRILVDHTEEMLRWLMGMGMVFVGPMPEEPHRVPRMHNIVPNGRAFSYHLTRYCCEMGVKILLSTRCTRLVERSGRVSGVEALAEDGERMLFNATHGVILTSGDYSSSQEMKRDFASPDLAAVDGIAPSSTGDGYRMALELGAEMVNGDIVRGPIMRFIPPQKPAMIQSLPPSKLIAHGIAASMRFVPNRILRPFLMSFLTTALGPSPSLFQEGAILVNQDGSRFTDEKKNPAMDVAKQSGGVAYIVFGQAVAEKFTRWPHFVSTAPGVAYAYLPDYRRSRKDIFHQAKDLHELARSIGVPPERLKYAIGELSPAIRDAPFYALGPVRSYVVFTEGGLRVTERLEVVRSGAPIPGLYAAGAVGQGGLMLEGHGHHLDWAFISGRLAAHSAVADGAS